MCRPMGWLDKNPTAATGASRVLGTSVVLLLLSFLGSWRKNDRTCHRGVPYPPLTAVPSIKDGYGLLVSLIFFFGRNDVEEAEEEE